MPFEVKVEGYCPMGCGQTLHVDANQDVYCAAPLCPQSHAMAEIMQQAQHLDHVVTLHEDWFSIVHPLRERLNVGQGLDDCLLHEMIASCKEPPAAMGKWNVAQDPNGLWVFFPYEQAPLLGEWHKPEISDADIAAITDEAPMGEEFHGEEGANQ